jgi:hypothetical protein
MCRKDGSLPMGEATGTAIEATGGRARDAAGGVVRVSNVAGVVRAAVGVAAGVSKLAGGAASDAGGGASEATGGIGTIPGGKAVNSAIT